MKNVHLGELEQEIMDIVWQKKVCSVRDVLTTLQKHRKIAYTTTATILQRLCAKELVVKQQAASGHIYKPNVSKQSYTKRIANSFLNNFIGSFGDEAIVSFADSIDKLPEKKRKYFLDLLDEYDKSK